MSAEPVSPAELLIDHLSAKGEGVARTPAGPVFAPFALPGERVVPRADSPFPDVFEPSADRAEPFCPAFGRCGGCAMQHMRVEAYAAWKRDLVGRALAREGFAVEVEPTVVAHGAGRRRAIVHVRFRNGRAEAGFMAAGSHDLQLVGTCPVLVPALADVFRIAAESARPLAGRNKPLDVQVTATEAGLDVDLRGHGAPEPAERLALTKVAEALDLARISIHRDVIVERRPPILDMGGTPVHLSPRSFLQATAEAEEALAALTLEGVSKAKSVADLFCGVGPFALRLAARAKVHAFDDAKEAIAALDRAARGRQGLKPIVAEARDLFRRPLLPMELKGFDAVVMDPPRAGAEAQAKQLAASAVKTIVSVSCDLQSFVRDAVILRAGGYRLERLTPVDQFAWSRHIELVGVFRR
ncbi:MAG: class I SAM-dependent RNA methyltransferase [Beijerinckiaceae bacterium]